MCTIFFLNSPSPKERKKITKNLHSVSHPTDALQVSEEVERALAKLGPARLGGTGRFGCYLLVKSVS